MSAVTLDRDPSFEKLLAYIKESRGFDFTGYKRASLMRRVARRMQSVHADSYDDYMDRLQVEPDEFTALFNTILINVTSFYRDPEAWAHLRSALVPEILTRRGDGPIRVWSAGCASGEEAYSLAICFAEVMGAAAFRRQVKIYATDVDEEALASARLGRYTSREVSGLPPELTDKYFEGGAEQRVFTKGLRRAIIFGRNDLVQDAPISHIDLLVCRNTLMYFDAETQARILQRLHYALDPGGILFLGKAELLLSHGRILVPVEGMRRFFRKVTTDPARERAFVLGAAHTAPSDAAADDLKVRQEAMLSAPTAQIVVDSAGRLALSNRRAETLFGVSGRQAGQSFSDLELSTRPVELRSLLDQVFRERRTIWVHEVEWARPGTETIWLDVQVVPLAGDERRALGVTVIFHDITERRALQHELGVAHDQLETAYEELQSTNEELETTNEELQSTVEELETTNEELQSTVEELETMNEELQSMNDELGSTNNELRDRAGEVDELNNFMESILASLKVAVAVVDRDLRVSAWNLPAQELWGVRSNEAVGRHLLDLDVGLPLRQFDELLEKKLVGPYDEHSTLRIDAVNRRGRPVTVQVTLSPLVREQPDGIDGHQVTGAIVVMDEIRDGA
ncbi:MAG: PAS domain S-box protein [Actinomycetota bacterium]|nr:PAS domain S-box protein [Actinomycetota bacterium]